MSVPLSDKSRPGEKRILVVDDDEHIRMLFQTTLSAEGFQAQTGRDGRELLKHFAAFRPDLIITDLMMPGGGGYEVLRTLQGDPKGRETPVIVITGHTLDATTINMLRQEPNVRAFLEKPVRMEKLMQCVHGILQTRSRTEERLQDRQDDLKDIDLGRFGF